MYYRIAIQNDSSSFWQWKSTILSSLDALFRLLRVYSALPQDCLRVFSSRSREEMDDLLARENIGLASASVTAERFLKERGIRLPTTIRAASEHWIQENQGARPVAVSATLLLNEGNAAEPAYAQEEWGLSALERRRFELEGGAGGDHDVPYTFTFPVSIAQVLAWTKLLAKVQSGELES